MLKRESSVALAAKVMLTVPPEVWLMVRVLPVSPSWAIVVEPSAGFETFWEYLICEEEEDVIPIVVVTVVDESEIPS